MLIYLIQMLHVLPHVLLLQIVQEHMIHVANNMQQMLLNLLQLQLLKAVSLQ